MKRRTFLPAAAAFAATAAAADVPKPVLIDFRRIQFRNSADNQRQRTSDFTRLQAAALQRAGAGLVGVFASSIAPHTPFLLTIVGYRSFTAMEEVLNKLAADAGYQKALEAYNAQPGLNYERIESSLLRAFKGQPAIFEPPIEGNRPTRIFEVRTYESSNTTTLRRKVKMFNDGEIGAFQRAGGQPVFFGADPEWQKLRATPGLSDAEIVSNISNYLVTPLPFSQIH